MAAISLLLLDLNGVLYRYDRAARKPDQAVDLRCLNALGAAPAETLFIDDSAANIAGARAANLHAHQVTDAAALTAELQARRLL